MHSSNVTPVVIQQQIDYMCLYIVLSYIKAYIVQIVPWSNEKKEMRNRYVYNKTSDGTKMKQMEDNFINNRIERVFVTKVCAEVI